MELYTLNRGFLKQQVVDGFNSLIWTERYYGDSDIELVVPISSWALRNLPLGTFVGLSGSTEVMILESVNIENGALKYTGISLLQWLNNRFVRTTNKHADKYWYINNQVPGQILWTIVYNMCCQGSPYLAGSIATGIANPSRLVIPGLKLADYDKSGVKINVGVPFGPVYDALKELATTYFVGMRILILSATDTAYSLGFQSYKGLDRTSSQAINAAVRFSPQMDSFTGIKELQSIAALKTSAYVFAPSDPNGLAGTSAPGVANLTPSSDYAGFDLRALLVFADDITTDNGITTTANLKKVLDARASDALKANTIVKTVDGEIVQEAQFQYGKDYSLGDIIEVQGNTGVINTARITEYIRSQDNQGERAYPTVAMIG
jgi:hypothetical protein